MARNAYFKVELEQDGVYFRVFKAEDGGYPLTFDEVTTYLKLQELEEYDIKKLNALILGIHNEDRVKVSNREISGIREMVKVIVADDKMSAYVKLYPPTGNGSLIGISDLELELKKNLITKGIKKDVLVDITMNKCYDKLYCVAVGKPQIEGSDALIEYPFEINKNAKPKMNEDGTVDFKNLDIIIHIKAGDTLAKFTPANLGEPGYDVFGAILKPKQVKKFNMRVGKNVYLSENQREAIAAASGHFILDDGKITVHNEYVIEADVDTSVGNIDFDGSIVVKGSVRSGYIIKASGDVEVRGIVEGATIISGGSIILDKGIQGMNRGVLDAQGNIVAKFIENSKVRCGGHLHTESILHSLVQASYEVNCDGRKGLISGGRIEAGMLISAKVIGSKMGTTTELSVGVNPIIVEEYNKLAKEIPTLTMEVNRLEQVIGYLNKKIQSEGRIDANKAVLLQKAIADKETFSAKLEELQEKYNISADEIDRKNDGKIKCSGEVFTGVRISIGNSLYYVREVLKYVAFVKDGVDIKLISY